MYNATILLVDDNTTNLNILLDYLHAQAYKVLIAPNGEQALHQLQHTRPDLILLDVMMPGIDGFETCRRLKANDAVKDIPVIFMTALSETVDKITGFQVGGVDYITKPFQHEEVLARVNAHLTIRKLQETLREQNTTLEKYTALLETKNHEMQAANALLDEKNAQLHALNADKDKFFSIIAHDLRNPIGALQELPQIMIDHIESYTKDDLIKIAVIQRDAAQNLFTLLENLLTWSRAQRGLIEHEPIMVPLIELVMHNFELLQPYAQKKQITLVNLIAPSSQVYADYKKLDTVFRNLLSNAVKFTAAGGTITLSLKQQPTLVEIAVADTGIGIDAKHLGRLFRIDDQYRRTGTANERGSGLGLLLCKDFIEAHGGQIWVESETGTGSVFKFTLPLPTDAGK